MLLVQHVTYRKMSHIHMDFVNKTAFVCLKSFKAKLTFNQIAIKTKAPRVFRGVYFEFVQQQLYYPMMPISYSD